MNDLDMNVTWSQDFGVLWSDHVLFKNYLNLELKLVKDDV